MRRRRATYSSSVRCSSKSPLPPAVLPTASSSKPSFAGTLGSSAGPAFVVVAVVQHQKITKRRMKSSFSSSFPDDLTTITAADAVPTDNAEAPAKDDSQEEAADGQRAGADGLSDALATTDGGGGSSFHHHQHHSTNFNHSNRGLKINLIIKINPMSFISIY